MFAVIRVFAAAVAATAAQVAFLIAASPGLAQPTEVGPLTTVTDVRGGPDAANAVAVTLDGGIVVAGSSSRPGAGDSSDFALVRYAATGDLDPAFGHGGKVTTDFGDGYDEARQLVVQRDGRNIALGFFNAPDGGVALARYRPDGSLDPAFGGGDGKVRFGARSLGDSCLSAAPDVALAPRGRIVVVGSVGCGG